MNPPFEMGEVIYCTKCDRSGEVSSRFYEAHTDTWFYGFGKERAMVIGEGHSEVRTAAADEVRNASR